MYFSLLHNMLIHKHTSMYISLRIQLHTLMLRIVVTYMWTSLVAQMVRCLPRRSRFDPSLRKILWKRKWQPTLVLLPGKSHGQRSLVGYSLWGREESDTTEQLHTLHMFVYIYMLVSFIQHSIKISCLLFMCVHGHSVMSDSL